MTQMQAAQKAMVKWLAHPSELGHPPVKIQCAGTFSLHGLQYYMFKYKKGLLGKWLLGVCGGYESGALDHCGHVFSQVEEYNEESAVEKATAMVEMIRAYWMKQAEQFSQGDA